VKRYLTLCGSVTTAHKTQNSHLLKLSINTILDDTNLHSGFTGNLPVHQVTAYTAHHKSNEIKPVSNHFDQNVILSYNKIDIIVYKKDPLL